MFEEKPEGSAEETEEEAFEKAIDLGEAESGTPEEFEEVSVPRAPSFSLNSLEVMLSVDELLVKAVNNPESLREVSSMIRKLREKSTRPKRPQKKLKEPTKEKGGKKGKEAPEKAKGGKAGAGKGKK
ncbi:MAG: hypothetical protein QW705_02875 [Zestosphaera sp.]